MKQTQMELKHRIPEQVIQVIRTLEAAGFEAWLVGGGIRDALLGREAEDWDVATSASAEQITRLFPHTAPLGARFGTVRILMPAVHMPAEQKLSGAASFLAVDAATFRIDSVYTDRRRPDAVSYTGSLHDDLKRRDFTINAMAWHPERGLFDPQLGILDLEQKRIRTVGNAQERFDEDPLRILRGIRFAAQLDYEIEEGALASMRDLAPLLEHISAERKQSELQKTILADQGGYGLSLLEQTGVMAYLLRESWNCAGSDSSDQMDRYHGLVAGVDDTPRKPSLRWGLLFLCFPAPGASNDIRSLRFDRKLEQFLLNIHKEREHLLDLLRPSHASSLAIAWKEFVAEQGWETAEEILSLVRNHVGISLHHSERISRSLLDLESIHRRIRDHREPVLLSDLAVSGADLLQAGVPAGKSMGDALRKLLTVVHQDPSRNTREELLALIRQ